MVVSFIRTIILYICVILALRIMGKRQLGELQPSELVVAIMISDLASVPMQSRNIPLVDGIVPIFALVMLELLSSVAIMKSEFLRRMITGRPTQIIKDGKILPSALSNLRICIDDVSEQLRLAGYTDFSEIDSAHIETNGQMSVIPKEAKRPTICSDFNLKPAQTHVPHTVIADGKLRMSNVKGAKITEKWLLNKLKSYNVTDIKNVLYMSITDDKEIFIQTREEKGT